MTCTHGTPVTLASDHTVLVEHGYNPDCWDCQPVRCPDTIPAESGADPLRCELDAGHITLGTSDDHIVNGAYAQYRW